MKKHVESYKCISEFINKYGKASKEDSSCIKEYCFSKNTETDESKINNFKLTETNNILESLEFIPIQLKNMYRIIGNPNIEYYFGEWILNSLINLKERLNIMLQEGNLNIVDFALRYVGMGHCIICSYDPSDGKIFFRRDGGSNGYERVDNWNFIKSYKPEVEKKHNFSVWLNKVEDDCNHEKYKEEPWLYFQDPMLINP